MGPLHPVYFSFFSLMGPGANCFIKHTGVLFYHSPAPPSPPTYVCANIFFLHTKWNTEANIKIKKKKKERVKYRASCSYGSLASLFKIILGMCLDFFFLANQYEFIVHVIPTIMQWFTRRVLGLSILGFDLVSIIFNTSPHHVLTYTPNKN